MAFSDFFLGTPARVEQIPQYSQMQQKGFNQLLQSSLSGLQNPYAGFEPIAQQAQKRFHEQIVPTLAERFSSYGDMSSSSPAFASQLGQAGAGLSENLAALQSQYGMLNRQGLLGQAQMGFTPQFQNLSMEGEQGFLGPLFSQLLPYLPAGIAAFTGNIPLAIALAGAGGGLKGLAGG